MLGSAFFNLPFFAEEHRKLASDLEEWSKREISPSREHDDVDLSCKEILHRLATAGWLRYVIPRKFGGVYDRFDLRSLCIVRECLARE
jgi:acyl-CoA dehydrogenase